MPESAAQPESAAESEEFEEVPEAAEPPEPEFVHLRCPDCRHPIALGDEDHRLPQHAVCATPWNPFGVAVCSGSGLDLAAVDRAEAAESAAGRHELATILTLPAGLDWRMQPFSHTA